VITVFSHAKSDLASFRLFTSQLIVQGSATQGHVARAPRQQRQVEITLTRIKVTARKQPTGTPANAKGSLPARTSR